MSRLLTVSPSPHIHTSDSTSKIMMMVVIALLPVLAWSVFVFGFEAIRVTIIAVASCMAFEFLIQKYILKTKSTITDWSALLTGLLLAFNVPSNLPWWIIIIGSLVSIGIAKLSFGGLGQNIFNPALVGRVFLLISFPVQMTSWPVTNQSGVDAVTGATPLGLIKEGLMSGKSISEISKDLPIVSDLFLGNMGGSLGEVSALMLIIGGLFLLIRKIITWHIPVSVIATVAAFSAVFWIIDPEVNINPLYQIFTGGLMLGAIFMATDMVTSPMTPKGQLIFGFGIGLLTILIRMFGAYPEGISFAILIMNALVPLINKYIKPARFGEIKKEPVKG